MRWPPHTRAWPTTSPASYSLASASLTAPSPTVMSLSLMDVHCRLSHVPVRPRRHLAEHAERLGLVAALPVTSRELQRFPGRRGRRTDVAREQVALGQDPLLA